MVPIGWIAFHHDGSGGATHSGRMRTIQEWRALPATGCLGGRQIYQARASTGRHYSDVFTGDWLYLFEAATGNYRMRRKQGEKPVLDPRGNTIPLDQIKEGFELTNQQWAAIYPSKFHERGRDNTANYWL